MYRNDVSCLECSGIARYREAGAVLACGDRCALGNLLHAIGKCILALGAGVDLLPFQHLGGIGDHGGHFAVGDSLLGHELALDKRKPIAVHRNLRIVGIGKRRRVGEGIGRALLKLVAETEVQRMRRKLSCRRLVRFELRAGFLVDQAELGRYHNIPVVAVIGADITIIVVRIVVRFDRHVEGFSQLLQPLNTCHFALSSKYLHRQKRYQHQHCKQRA